MSSRITRKQFMIIGALMLCAMLVQARPVIRLVTNTNDSGPGSLRQALAEGHDGDLINFATALHGQTITLTSGELVVDKNVTVSGPGPDSLAISRSSNMPFRIFHIMAGHSVTIQGVTVTGGGLGFSDAGGGIFNDHATLTVRDCDIKFNASAYGGGGVFSDGSNGSATLTVIDSTVSSNSSPFGGGIVSDVGNQGTATLTVLNSAVTDNISTNGSPPYDFGAAAGIASSGTAMINNSTISGNLASNEGGGILSDGALTITNSTISGNGAGGFGQNNWPGVGGGISSGGALAVSNSTISGNTAAGNDFKGLGHGGGVFNYGGSTATLNNCTFSGNGSNIGGGVCNNGAAEVRSTIFNAGLTGENIVNSGGTITSHGYNVSSDDAGGFLNGPGDQINTNPLLGPLQDNGGPTFTHALLPGSPAIDAGDPSFTPPPYYDQRGLRFRRVFNGRIDVGSFEVQPTPPPFPTPRPRPTPVPRPVPQP